MRIKSERPYISRVFSIFIVVLGIYVCYYNQPIGLTNIIGSLLFLGFGAYLWLLSNIRIDLSNDEQLIVHLPLRSNKIAIKNINNIVIKNKLYGDDAIPYPQCLITYTEASKIATTKITLWGFPEQDLQTLFDRLHNLNNDINRVSIKNYFPKSIKEL